MSEEEDAFWNAEIEIYDEDGIIGHITRREWHEWGGLQAKVEKLQIDIKNLESFIVKTAENHVDLCRQLGTHRPITNVGCFGTAECVNCFKIGFAIYKHSEEKVKRLRKFIDNMAEEYGIPTVVMKELEKES